MALSSSLGPRLTKPLLGSALNVLLVYLAGSSVSILENTLVEKEQAASAVYSSTDERPVSVIWFVLSSVATEKLAEVEKRFFEVLRETASKPLAMDYMLGEYTLFLQTVVRAETSTRMYSSTTSSDQVSGGELQFLLLRLNNKRLPFR